MHGDGAHRVVDLHNGIKEVDRDGEDQAGGNADDGGAHGRDGVAPGGDGHQASQSGVESHADIGLLIAQPGVEHGDAGGHSGGQVGVDEDQTGGDQGLIAIHGHGGAAVEAEPAEPQDEHAQSAQGQVVADDGAGVAVLVILADAGTQEGGADGGAHTAHHMDRGGTGEIMEAQLAQPAAAPDPVAGDGIDESGDAEGVDAVGDELGALRHGAGDDGGSRGAEHGLEDQEREQGHARGKHVGIVAQNKGVEAADDGAGTAEHEAEAQNPVGGGTDAEVHQVFHQDVAGVLGTGEARLAHGETGLHKEDQGRAQQDPYGVDS